MVQRALVLAAGPVLTVEDFAFNLDDPPAARTRPRAPSSASLRDDLKDEERRRILDALEHCQGNQSSAARQLGIPRRTLVERLRAYGVPRKRKE